jgi:hypothetical protein
VHLIQRVSIVTILFFCVSLRVAAAQLVGTCEFPAGLGAEIAEHYPGSHLITLAELSEDDKKFYQRDHGTRCPGIVKVDFYGDGKPTWALVLISKASPNPKERTKLVVAHQLSSAWHFRQLDTTDDNPVVWRQNPGKYQDVYKTATIDAKYPVIVFCGYSSWAILYSWTGTKVQKIWLAD